ncbi:DUF2470 domain-containing protein [Alteromonas sediminis]|uniref:DUF2470 domain-containing protein n=1 Tax=Alteromonas sediminis TaxID=2259342 RepID=A0A3N5YCL8_9ALTE|nr:DUF2470 domain-containing protein [Alteromonas sediminis]RPJ67015.1 DUF2470 domain-containing protein [Alteromonas sediminis]
MTQHSLAQTLFDARKLARQQHSGVLSTQSLSMKGFPFGSVTPYLMNDEGDLILYASDIAQHSRNMKAEPQVSLCIYDGSQADSQANARLTFMGQAQALSCDPKEANEYFNLFPQAHGYVNAHDFRFYRVKVERLRYIGGFGDIHWLKEADWRMPIPAWKQNLASIIEHMHEDHADALALIVNHCLGTNAVEGDVEMLSAYAEGFYVSLAGNRHFIPFVAHCLGDGAIRSAMVTLTQRARQSESVSQVAVA